MRKNKRAVWVFEAEQPHTGWVMHYTCSDKSAARRAHVEHGRLYVVTPMRRVFVQKNFTDRHIWRDYSVGALGYW